jgi:hypothetical protein
MPLLIPFDLSMGKSIGDDTARVPALTVLTKQPLALVQKLSASERPNCSPTGRRRPHWRMSAAAGAAPDR